VDHRRGRWRRVRRRHHRRRGDRSPGRDSAPCGSTGRCRVLPSAGGADQV